MISVLIIAKNAEGLIGSCIKSVKWADEVVVVDTGSTDNTVHLAKELGSKVFQYTGEGNNFSSWRNFGLSKITGEWLLVIDSDERALQGMREEINEIISTELDFGAWKISRRNIVLGKELGYGAFWPDYVIRFFRVNRLKKWEGLVHEQPVFEGKLGRLVHSLLHLTHRDIDSMVIKSLEWADYDAKLRFESHHPPMSGWRFIRIMITEIWKQGFVRGGFFGRTEGVIDSILQVFSMYLSYVKLWQLQHKPSLEETYQEIDKKLIDQEFKY